MKEYLDNLKTWANEYPGQALAAAGIAVIAVARLMQANTDRQRAKDWKREVERRSMKDAAR